MAEWTLDQNRAHCHGKQLEFRVDLAYPNRGLTGVEWSDDAWNADTTLAISALPEALDSGEIVVDAYVRGNDLVVSYAETERRGYGMRVYWRWIAPGEGVEGVEILVSVQTSRLESHPQIRILTVASAAEAICLGGSGSAWSVVEGPDEVPRSLPAALFRNPIRDQSFAQIVHPADFQGAEVSPSGRLESRLSSNFMEKGVIRTLRVQGLWMTSRGDKSLAEQCLSALAASVPPLTS